MFGLRTILASVVLEFAGVTIFSSISNRIFNVPTGHPKDLPANQRQDSYRVPEKD